jgi:hypothetical protein
MGSLDRLREVLKSDPAGRAGAGVARRELTYEPLGADGEAVTPQRAWLDLPGTRGVETPFGEVCVVERAYGPDAWHGRVRVDECRLLDADAITVLRGRPFDPAVPSGTTPIFVDLETTGLHGGAGTVAFLVGLGGFDAEGAFRTQQFFLPGFAAERAMLHAVGEAVAEAPLIVTYNGGSFDLPVMETRWLFHRLVPALESRPHLDMLPPARRLWKERLGGNDRSCRLVALEQSLLGWVRVGDVPGADIPTRYFEFVRTGDAAPLEPVLEHNRLDLLSLAVLLARAQRLVIDGPASAADGRECLALGRVYDRAGRLDLAEAAFRAAAEHPVSDRATAELAWLSLARLLRRRRRYGDAAFAWRTLARMTDRQSGRRAEAVEALAVHHEHRERNLALARALAQRVLSQAQDPERRAVVRHRLDRLDRKLARLRSEQADTGTPARSLPWDGTDPDALDADGDRGGS